MDRRAFLRAAGLGSLATFLANSGVALGADNPDAGAASPASPAVTPTKTAPFSWDILNARAEDLAKTPFNPGQYQVNPALAALNYDQYRFIRFEPEKAIWHDVQTDYQIQLFHPGYIYREMVEVFIVENGMAAPVPYDKSLYHFGPAEKRGVIPDHAGGFSGLRLHSTIERPGVFEEFLVFQGASYFRGKPKLQTYGLSARGLAINTLQPEGEEFPGFRAFWAETPKPGDKTVTVYALLDSISITGAYRFVCEADSQSGDIKMDVECRLFPRRSLKYVGIAAFSSMFFFGPADHTDRDDFRVRVHDSDGLSLLTSFGDWVWRPIVNAPHALYSVFSGGTPGGFGLIQRPRQFYQYEDINAGYHKRPSAWVEPLNDWGEGSVDLIEIPTTGEYDDNVVTFWRPKTPLQPGAPRDFSYRLTWTSKIPVKRNLATVVQTRCGIGTKPGSRFLIIDFAGGDVFAHANEEYWDYHVSASAGHIKEYTIGENDYINGKRIGIEYYPDGKKDADLTFQIRRFGKPLSEKWVYRWAP
ncbi:MAG: glucan biosynthesis protein [Alphaproteobacteria bacterium]